MNEEKDYCLVVSDLDLNFAFNSFFSVSELKNLCHQFVCVVNQYKLLEYKISEYNATHAGKVPPKESVKAIAFEVGKFMTYVALFVRSNIEILQPIMQTTQARFVSQEEAEELMKDPRYKVRD